mgnify:CR=1 FL=1
MQGAAGRADLRDILHPWFESLVVVLERAAGRGELSPGFPVTVTAQAWLGYVVYRVVFLQQEITPEDLTALIHQALGPGSALSSGPERA